MGDDIAVPSGTQPGRDRLHAVGVVEQVDLAVAGEHPRDPLRRVTAVDADLRIAPAATRDEQLDGAVVGASDVEVTVGIWAVRCCPHAFAPSA